MKVLTIKEPYASLISYGIKRYEFRTWNTKYRGELLIHSGKGVDKDNLYLLDKYNIKRNNGKIIAKCKLTDSIKVDDKFKETLRKENYEVYKKIIEDKRVVFAFVLEDVRLINPIEIDGKLSLWNYDY